MADIVFCVSSMHTGGAERVAALLCNRWAELGHNITLVVTYRFRGTCDHRLHKNVKLVYLAEEINASPYWGPEILRRILNLRRLITQTNPHAIYSFMTLVNVLTILATRFMRIPIVISERSYPPKVPLPRLLKIARWVLYPSATQVVLQTQEGLSWLKRKIPLAKGALIPNPVRIPIPSTSPKYDPRTLFSKEFPIVLAVGRLGPEKQFDILLAAFAKVYANHPNAVLAIIGEGPELTRLEKLAEDLGVEKVVHFVGRVGNIQDWYNIANLFVLSSEFEGFPNALLEAVCCGVTAVSFDCLTGPRDIFSDADQSALVPPNSGAEGLAKAMNLALQGRIAKPNTAKLQAWYSDETIAVQWLRLGGIE